MSAEKINKQDEVKFVTQKDDESPSKMIHPEPEPFQGPILPNGDINWDCPCLNGAASKPCGPEFREAVSCFYYSTAEPKGSDCSEKFAIMLSCMSQYPTLYGKQYDDDDDVETDDKEQQEHQHEAPSQNEIKHEDKIINDHKNDETTSNDEQIQRI